VRYIQHPETLELVEAEEYISPRVPGPYVRGDIKPYESVITGETITSRSKHREHLRRHNCQEVGDNKPSWMRERQYEHKHRR